LSRYRTERTFSKLKNPQEPIGINLAELRVRTFRLEEEVRLKKLTFFVIAACLAALVPASLRANEALLKAFEKGETETIIRLFKDNQIGRAHV
jgi:hypothetical protein